jgi:esterase/lipase superfamily enzyme
LATGSLLCRVGRAAVARTWFAEIAMIAKAAYRVLIFAVLAVAPGCSRNLVATPNLLLRQDPDLYYAQCPGGCRMAEAPVLYATDRANDADEKGAPDYGHKRARSLSYGIAGVRLNPDPTWRELLQDSTAAKRSREYELKLADVRQHGNIKPTFGGLGETGVITQASTLHAMQQRERFDSFLSERLERAANKDVYIFVHGFNNAFDDSVFRAAEVWHFMGRVGVPVAYSWPAGLGGLRGYAYDRESGEFTVSHLRHFIRTVAECPDVERVHLIAHSRGCDVLISALRELHIGYRAQGKSTQEELKLENLVLAAPDIDEEVFMQRFVGENLLQAAKRTTIYASRHDKAIELSDIIFASRRRLGMLSGRDFSPKMRHTLAKLPNVQFIECKLTGLWLGHSYIYDHPAALSDLILVLRDRLDPGAANGRPLRQPAEGIWELTDDYLK